MKQHVKEVEKLAELAEEIDKELERTTFPLRVSVRKGDEIAVISCILIPIDLSSSNVAGFKDVINGSLPSFSSFKIENLARTG